MNHGWVTPNTDGTKARCGGPALCRTCQAEAEALCLNAGYQQQKTGVDGSAGRMDYLYDRIAELVTSHGPRYVTRGMKRQEVYEAIVECIEALAQKVEDLEDVIEGMKGLEDVRKNGSVPLADVEAQVHGRA